MRHASRELENAWVDWTFGVDLDPSDERDGFSLLADLESRGYKWVYVGESVPRDLPIGAYAILVDEFPLGDVVVSKKLVRPRHMREYDLVPIGMDTQRAAAKRVILHYFEKHHPGEPIEVRHWRDPNVALIHPATRQHIGWQGSMFDEYGPYSHKEGRTAEEVLDKLIADGFTVPDPGGMDRMLGS